MIYTKYEWYRWKWTHYPEFKIVKRVPIHIDVELITKCNYKCPFCEMSFNPPEPMDMPFKMAKKIIKEFAEKGGSSVKLVYIGEPLLYKKLAEVIRYAKKKGIIEVIIATNGSLLTEEWSKKLIKTGLDWITFSVDSCKPEIYKQIRVNGNLKIVTKNIRNFHRIRFEMKSNTPKIVIQCIRMNLNEKEIESEEYEQFWKPFVDEIRISQLEDYTITEPIGETPKFFCNSVYRRLTVRADGKIAVCCGERSDDKIIGDINEMSIEEAWSGREFTAIRNLMNEGKSHLIDICKTCTMRLNYVRDKQNE